MWVKLVFPRSFLLFAVGHFHDLGTTLVLVSAHHFALCFVKSQFFRSGHTLYPGNVSIPYHWNAFNYLEGIWVIKSKMWLLPIENSQFFVLMPLYLLLGCDKFYSKFNNSCYDRSKKLLWHLGPNIYQTCKDTMQLLCKCDLHNINNFFFTLGAGNQKCIYMCCFPQTLSLSCSSKNLKYKVTNQRQGTG